jgi:alpha-1,3-rhamnosyl/mannosyltransferase
VPSALVVGINAAPLVAPRTGVGRYILGLLAGLRSIAPIGGQGDSQDAPAAAGAPFEVRALFAPASALGAEGPSAVRESRLRSLVKALPLAYEAREALRSLSLAREQGLSLLHETNHAAPRTRLPVVLTVHDLCTLLYPETQEPGRARFFARALRERAREARQVITPTAAIARQVVALLGVEAGRVRAIHHGIDAALLSVVGREKERAGPPALLQRAGVEGPYLLFVGALEPRKGLPVLLDAYDQLPAALAEALPLVRAGPAQRVDRALARRLTARRAGRIVQTGFVAPGDLPALYRGAAALCLPSIYEGFGLPLAEALACGTPCLVSDDPSLLEVAAGAALVAPRGDAAAFAGHLAALAADPALRERLSAAGPVRAAAYTWEASARAHLAAYRAAVDAP